MCNHDGAETVMVNGMEVKLCEDCMPRPTAKKVSDPHDGISNYGSSEWENPEANNSPEIVSVRHSSGRQDDRGHSDRW